MWNTEIKNPRGVGERSCPFPKGGGGGFREVILWCCMASSKASRHFQHLKIGCPSLPQKLQGSPVYFLVLEEDSLDLEVLPFRDYFLASNLGVSLEEHSLATEFVLCFGFFFDFSIDVWATNAWVFDPIRESNYVSLDCSLVKRWQKILKVGMVNMGAKASIVEWKVEEKIWKFPRNLDKIR